MYILGYGQRLRLQREKKGIEQGAFAELVGTTQQEISRIETGKPKKINLELLMKAAKVLEVPPGWLLFGVEGIDDLESDAFRIAYAWQKSDPETRLDVAMKLLASTPVDVKELPAHL
jgi:transcriptional regulator with XRE-family HTH domain